MLLAAELSSNTEMARYAAAMEGGGDAGAGAGASAAAAELFDGPAGAGLARAATALPGAAMPTMATRSATAPHLSAAAAELFDGPVGG